VVGGRRFAKFRVLYMAGGCFKGRSSPSRTLSRRPAMMAVIAAVVMIAVAMVGGRRRD